MSNATATINNFIEISPEITVATLPQIMLNIFFALALILIGIFIGKLTKFIFRKIIETTDLRKIVKYQFINLGLTLVKWSIYLVFFALALQLLPFPGLTETLAKFIVVVPALASALILLFLGFLLAVYLRDLIEDSEIKNYRILSSYMFYFVLYIFGVYTIKISLVSLEPIINQIVTVLFTIYFGLFIVLHYIYKGGY